MPDGINAKALDEDATASNPKRNASVLDLDTNPTLIDLEPTVLYFDSRRSREHQSVAVAFDSVAVVLKL